jgi:ribosomal protein S18 acetylase RimI-like enzyme
MATLSKPLVSTSTEEHLRPFDVRRDLRPVADLVELCFAETLDADGRDYLRRMRSAARSVGLLRLASTAMEWASVPLAGYVWQQDDQVVGNVSVIPYFVHRRRFYLIANVAVHPDYRRRGIARSLTSKAIEHARWRKSSSVWLHVREENEAALRLYRSLNFVERARRTSWSCQPGLTHGEFLDGKQFVAPRTRDWEQQRAWLQRAYPPELSWHIPFNLNTLHPGLLGAFFRLLYGVYIRQWAMRRDGRLLGVVSWQASATKSNLVWLAFPPEVDETSARALLLHLRQNAPTKRTLMLDSPAELARQAIQGAGFMAHQTLIWMSLSLSQNQ